MDSSNASHFSRSTCREPAIGTAPPLRWALATLLCVAVSGCSSCEEDLPEPTSSGLVGPNEGSGRFASFGEDGGEAGGSTAATADDEEAEREYPERGAPTTQDIAVAPVNGHWSTYRGDERRSGLRDAPGIERPRIAWSAHVGIQGYGNVPVLHDGTVYVSSQGEKHDESDALDGIVAIDAQTGDVRWRTSTDIDANGLAVGGGLVVATTDSGKIYAWLQRDGADRWSRDISCPSYISPVIRGTMLYLVRRDDFAVLDLQTGQTLSGDVGRCRRSERGALSRYDDTFFRFANDGLPSAWQGGDKLWSVQPIPGARARSFDPWAPPVVTQGLVIAGFSGWRFPMDDSDRHDRREAAVAYWRDNGQIAWVIDINGYQARDPNDPFDNATAFLRTVPWVAGSRVFWTPTSRAEISVYSALSGTKTGEIPLPDCRRRQFASIVGTLRADGGGTGYLARHDGNVYAFDAGTLTPEWWLSLREHGSYEGGGRWEEGDSEVCTPEPVGDNNHALFSTPAIGQDGTLFVGSGEGYLYAIRDREWEAPR